MRSGRVLLAAVAVALGAAGPAAAGGWLPHAADATWAYQWTDSVYNATPTNEAITVKSQSGSSFTLAWTTDGQDNPPPWTARPSRSASRRQPPSVLR